MIVEIGNIEQLLPRILEQIKPTKILVLTDQNTKKHCYPLLKKVLPAHHVLSIKSGEEHKTLDTCSLIWQKLTDMEADRHALMINMGGGVIGDMGGFCAATYKRGIPFIQIPSTLLSQVDASVGGKLGIDFQGFKNHIGVFQIPDAVLIDPVFLQTLPYNEKRSGFAEIIKHCIIQDADKWNEIKIKDFEEQNFPDLIAHSVAIKEQVVQQDPTEKGLRKILNFGHTLGHAIETYFLHQPGKKLLHGEAIAIGMICEAWLAMKKGLIDLVYFNEIEEFLFTIYGKVNIAEADLEPILKHTLQDKKNKGGQVRFSLLNGRGNCDFDQICSKSEMKNALKYYLG